MSKELEKLVLIQKVFEKLADWNGYDLSRLDRDYETNFDIDFVNIEKALKAFEIIKETFKITFDDEELTIGIDDVYFLTFKDKTKYDLLKDVLGNKDI